MYEKFTNFSRETVCKPGELTHRKFGTTSPQFSKQSDPNVFVFDQEQARTMADHFPSSVVSTRKTRRHLVALRNWGRFKPCRNAKWNRKFQEIPNFQEKGQPREVNRSLCLSAVTLSRQRNGNLDFSNCPLSRVLQGFGFEFHLRSSPS